MKLFATFLLFLVFSPKNLSAQIGINEIKTFLEGEELLELSIGNIYAYELLTNKELQANDSIGIYRIGVFASHSMTYLLLLDREHHKFLDCFSNLAETLKATFAFFDSTTRLTDVRKLCYLRKIVDIFESNQQRVPW